MVMMWCIIYAATMLLVGFAIVAMILGPQQQRSVLEIAALVLVLGVGSTGTLQIWISMLGLKQGRGVTLMLAAASIAMILLLAITRRLPCRPALPRFDEPLWKDILSFPLVLALAAANGISAINSVGFGQYEWDAFIAWAFKSKVLYAQALYPRPAFFNDLAYSFVHRDYPLLVPMLIAGGYSTMGEINEPLSKIYLPMLYLGQTLFAYLGARIWLSRPRAMLVATLLICAPYSVEFSGIGNADSTFEAFYFGSVFCLVQWTIHHRRSDILFSALFTIFVATTKAEGMPVAAISAAVLLAFSTIERRRRDWIDAAIFTGIVAFGAGVWWVWRMKIPHTYDDYASRLSISIFMQNLGRLGTIIVTLLKEFIFIPRWGFFWVFLALASILGYRGFFNRQAWLLWTLLILHVGLYVFVYIITDWDIAELLEVSRARLMLHAAPAAMMLIALHWSAVRTLTGPAE